MNRVHSDVEMDLASMIAYQDIPVGMTLGEYLDINRGDESLRNIVDLIDNNGLDDCLNWRVMAVADDENQSGMYGCMLDDGNGEAIVAFRGSVGLDAGALLTGDKEQRMDWISADLGLLDGQVTYQQEREREFVRQLYEQYGDRYNYTFTGHSLGGNLAMDAAITAPEGMRDNIRGAVGLDSPGFSSEYWEEHADQIAEMEGRFTHYRWSPVGALLVAPGTEMIVDTSDKDLGFARHGLQNLIIVDGHVIERPGGQPLADEIGLGGFSNFADDNSFLSLLIGGGSYLSNLVDRGNSGWGPLEVDFAAEELKVIFSGMNRLKNALDDAAQELQAAADSVADCASTIRYFSGVGALFKRKLNDFAVLIGKDRQAASLLSSAIEESVSNYNRAESSVVGMFEQV